MLEAFTGKVLLLFLSLWEIWVYYQFLYATCIEKTQLLKWQQVVMQISILSIGILFTINRNILFFSHAMFLFGIISFILILWIVEKKNFLLLASLTLAYFSSVALLDFFFAFFEMCMIEDGFAENIYFSGNQIEKIVIYFCSRICITLIVVVIKKYEIKKNIYRFRYIFIIISIALTVIILMQESKSAGLGAIAGAADTYWGKNKGRSMEGGLVKATTVMGVLFFVLAVVLNLNF